MDGRLLTIYNAERRRWRRRRWRLWFLCRKREREKESLNVHGSQRKITTAYRIHMLAERRFASLIKSFKYSYIKQQQQQKQHEYVQNNKTQFVYTSYSVEQVQIVAESSEQQILRSYLLFHGVFVHSSTRFYSEKKKSSESQFEKWNKKSKWFVCVCPMHDALFQFLLYEKWLNFCLFAVILLLLI